MDNNLLLMQCLVNRLNNASKAYYGSGKTIMSDTEYDKKLEKLKELEEKCNCILSNSPTINVGYAAVDSIDKMSHEHAMLSLDKAHTCEEVMKFAGNKKMIAMFKMDGLTISATYQDGELVRLETRGNGDIGNDILFHARSFENLPIKINKSGKYVIDGEAIITYDDFEELNKKMTDDLKYKNPRNLAAGTLNNLDANISKTRHLKFVAWDVIEGCNTNSLFQNLNEAEFLGFTVVPRETVISGSINKSSFKKNVDDMRLWASDFGYPIDGIVFKFDDIEYGKSLGRTSKFFNNAIAYKFEDDRYETKLIDVDWTMGKTGVITPTIITEPVEIDGTIVERASIHNVSIFKRMRFTKGCTCYLYKANMIIPQCDGTEDDGEEEMEIPSVCPVCGGMTKVVKSNATEILICTNVNCKGKLLGKLSHFVSKNAMNIDGMSEKTLEKLIDLGWLTDFKDIYHLSDYRTRMYRLYGFNKKSVDRLLDSIEKSRNTTLERFIYGISIPGVGLSTSKDMTKYCIEKSKNSIDYDSVNWFLNEGCTTNWTVIDGIGEVLDESIRTFLIANEDMLHALSTEFTFEENATSTGSNLSGMTFVITGSLKKFSNRDELIAKIEAAGGKVSGSVSKNTTYLINNDKESSSSKNVKAKQLGVQIISEEDFLNILN